MRKNFLDLYFDYIVDECNGAKQLLPLPQAHLYLKDPLTEDSDTFVTKKSSRIDFLFWNGKKLVAAEIDGDSPSHETNAQVERDRKFVHARIPIIHITNQKIDKYGIKIITNLLTEDII